MFRIIQDESEISKPTEPQVKPKELELDFKHHLLLNVMGLVVAEAPEKVHRLLEDHYSIELSRDCPEEDLADALILAIGECNVDFDRDLASLILDRTLDSSYDQYDFRQLAGQAATILSSVGNSQNADGQSSPGVLGNLTSTIGQIGGIISQATQSQSAGDQARRGIIAYRRQLAEQRESEEKKKNNILLFLILTALGIGVIGLISNMKRQSQPIIKTS